MEKEEIKRRIMGTVMQSTLADIEKAADLEATNLAQEFRSQRHYWDSLFVTTLLVLFFIAACIWF